MFRVTKSTQTNQQVFELLAEMVEYPTPSLLECLSETISFLTDHSSLAAKQLARFSKFADANSLGDLEELYTSTFDLKPVCYPYVGYQLFGDTYKRGAFLAQLNARYREQGLNEIAGELPDHLGMILRYLAHVEDEALVAEGVIPTLKKMIDQLKDNPYRDVMRAVLKVLQNN